MTGGKRYSAINYIEYISIKSFEDVYIFVAFAFVVLYQQSQKSSRAKAIKYRTQVQ